MDSFSPMQGPLQLLNEFTKRWTAIATEMAEHTKWIFEDGTHALAKLMSAKSFEQAVEIQTEFARRAYEAHLRQMTKLTSIYAELAKLPQGMQ